VVMTVLVAYASAHGSTQGVAEAIARGLERSGVGVEVRAAADVGPVAGYQGVVLGSAIHNGRWLTPALLLLADVRSHGPRALWLFSVCTIGDTTSFLGPRLSRLGRRSRKLPPGVAEVEAPHRWFAGAIARSHWGAAGRLFFTATGGRYGDHRDWDDIDAWATTIAASLTSEQHAT
jgi:menaquinone-dependent protoporphyrinogen oxidase